jgi:hypothetical protein
MAYENAGLVATGARLLWRHQRVLWWVFAVNLLLGLAAAHTVAHTLHETVSRTLAGEPLVSRFDLGMFFELVERPEVNLLSSHGESFLSAFLFFVFMLFVTGGILAVYREDRKLTTGEFFGASGSFFWRFVRLMLLSLIPFAVLGFLCSMWSKFSDFVDDRSVAGQTWFYVLLLGIIVLTLLALWVRLWFDIAQVRAVVQAERGMWRNTWKAYGITWRNLGTLFRVYFCISFFAWVAVAVGLWIWTMLPARTIAVTFLWLELMVLTQIGARLWQRASAMAWYQRHAIVVPTDAADYTTPHPVELVESPAVELPATDALPVRPDPPLSSPGPEGSTTG